VSNMLPMEEIQKIRVCFSEGRSIRETARVLGMSANTVKRYIPKNDARVCGCGKPVGHKGWCKALYAKSIARQNFHRRRSGLQLFVELEQPPSRISAWLERKARILGVGDEWRDQVVPLPHDEQYGAIGEVYAATAHLRHEYKQDVRSAMVVAVIEGRLDRSEIRKRVGLFVNYELRCMTGGPSMVALVYDGGYL
jgi:hypothetical protein